MDTETVLRDTCRAIAELEKIAKPRKTPYAPWELKEIARLYADRKITLAEMAFRINRPVVSVHRMIDRLGAEKREPRKGADQHGVARRNCKIVDAMMAGDGLSAVMRRWDVCERRVYEILLQYRRRTRMSKPQFRAIFLGGKSRFP